LPDDDLGHAAKAKTEPTVEIVEVNKTHAKGPVHHIYRFLYWYPDKCTALFPVIYIYPLPKKATEITLRQHMCSQYTILCCAKAIRRPPN
jgi:hypothetical protein